MKTDPWYKRKPYPKVGGLTSIFLIGVVIVGVLCHLIVRQSAREASSERAEHANYVAEMNRLHCSRELVPYKAPLLRCDNGYWREYEFIAVTNGRLPKGDDY